VSAIVVGRDYRFDALTAIENSLVSALDVALPQRGVVYKEVTSVTDDERVLVVRGVVWTLEGDEPIVRLRETLVREHG
jgi:hypothetical protein